MPLVTTFCFGKEREREREREREKERVPMEKKSQRHPEFPSGLAKIK
jgi:hypothetical protein